MLTKPSPNDVSVTHAFDKETTFGYILKLGRVNLQWSTFDVAKILEIGTETTFGWFLNLGKVNLEGSTFEVAKIWEIDLKNADKTVSK